MVILRLEMVCPKNPWHRPEILGTYSPEKLTYPLKIDGWKMTSLFKVALFRGHDNFFGVDDYYCYYYYSISIRTTGLLFCG